jgi:hypothetical protein
MPTKGHQESKKQPAAKRQKIVPDGAVSHKVLAEELTASLATVVVSQGKDAGCSMKMSDEDFLDSQDHVEYDDDVFGTMAGTKHVSSTPCLPTDRPCSSFSQHCVSSAKTPSTGVVSRMSASSTASSSRASSCNAPSSDADGTKELELPCWISLEQTTLDSTALPVVMARVSMLPKIAALRPSKWVLVMGEGGRIRICVNDLRDVIVHLLFSRILVDMEEKNPVDAILKSLNKTGEYVAGRAVISDNYFNYLDSLNTNLIKQSIQRIHEHLKYSFRDPWRYVESRGCVKPGTYLSWLDPTSVGVLRKATQDWSPKNTSINKLLLTSSIA